MNDGVGKLLFGLFAAIALSIGAHMWGMPYYNVWQQGLEGEAVLAKATQDRQVKVLEARAKKESAALLGEAEVARAKGVAEANKIMAESLGGSQGYLQWKYISMLEETGKGSGRETIYIPTEGMMPLMEAGRLKAPPHGATAQN